MTGVGSARIEELAREFGLQIDAGQRTSERPAPGSRHRSSFARRASGCTRRGPAATSTTGWTRWVLEQYEFDVTTVHNADIRSGGLRQRFDAVIFADQNPRDIVDGYNVNLTFGPSTAAASARRASSNLSRFVAEGGTLVTLGAASDLAIDRLPIPVREPQAGAAARSALRAGLDPAHPGRHVASDRLRHGG